MNRSLILEDFKPVIKHSAYFFILVHNHPSGDPSPSDADLRLTRRINEVSRILQLSLIDHVIIGSLAPGRSSYFSFKEGGVISVALLPYPDCPTRLPTSVRFTRYPRREPYEIARRKLTLKY